MNDWKAKESAVLALGAISEGFFWLEGHLSEIVRLIAPTLTTTAAAGNAAHTAGGPHPLLAATACWALSRYIAPIAATALRTGGSGSTLFHAVFSCVLTQTAASHPKVQCAATSALDTCVVEVPIELLMPVLDATVDALSSCCARYRGPNLALAYSVAARLAGRVGASHEHAHALATARSEAALLGPLAARMVATQHVDWHFLSLAQAMADVLPSFGPFAHKYVPGLAAFSARVLEVQAAQGQQAELVHRQALGVECAVVALDLMAAALGTMRDAGDAGGAALLDAGAVACIVRCCDAEDPAVRQSAFALVGTLATALPSLVSGCVHDVVRAATRCMAGVEGAEAEATPSREAHHFAINNACWAMREVFGAFGPGLGEQALDAVARALPYLERTAGYPRALIDNAALLVGACAAVCAPAMAPHLDHFLWNWLVALSTMCDSREKEGAFHGLCAMLACNPDAGAKHFASVCNAVASWREIKSADLSNALAALLRGYRQRFASQGTWDAIAGGIQPKVLAKLTERGLV